VSEKTTINLQEGLAYGEKLDGLIRNIT